jgi:hypothetical protein
MQPAITDHVGDESWLLRIAEHTGLRLCRGQYTDHDQYPGRQIALSVDRLLQPAHMHYTQRGCVELLQPGSIHRYL